MQKHVAEQVREVEIKLLAWDRADETSRRLQSVPGLGPITASATTRCGIAEWLVKRLAEDAPTLVGIDHGFSFPIRYFDEYGLKPLRNSHSSRSRQHTSCLSGSALLPIWARVLARNWTMEPRAMVYFEMNDAVVRDSQGAVNSLRALAFHGQPNVVGCHLVALPNSS